VKHTWVMVTSLAIGLGGIGCGGGDKSPKEKCDDLVNMFCDRLVECVQDAAGMHSACVQTFESIQSCSAIKSVGASYDDCLSQLDSQTCQMLFPMSGSASLPSACSGVLSTQSGRAPAPSAIPAPLSGAVRDMARVYGP